MARDRDDDRDDDKDARDERPSRRRRDDDDDAPAQLGPLDKMFRDTNIVFLILFGLCCRGLALILSAVGYFTAKDPKAKKNALIVMCIDGALTALAIILNVTGALAGLTAGK